MFSFTRAAILALTLSVLGSATNEWDTIECLGSDKSIHEQGLLSVHCSRRSTIYIPWEFSIGLPDRFENWSWGEYAGLPNQIIYVSTGNKTRDEVLYALQIMGGRQVLKAIMREETIGKKRLAEFADRVLEIYETTGNYYPDYERDWREVYDWNEEEKEAEIPAHFSGIKGIKDMFESLVKAGRNVLFVN